MSFYQYRKAHCGDKINSSVQNCGYGNSSALAMESFLHNDISHTDETVLYWNGTIFFFAAYQWKKLTINK